MTKALIGPSRRSSELSALIFGALPIGGALSGRAVVAACRGQTFLPFGPNCCYCCCCCHRCRRPSPFFFSFFFLNFCCGARTPLWACVLRLASRALTAALDVGWFCSCASLKDSSAARAGVSSVLILRLSLHLRRWYLPAAASWKKF